MDTTNRSLSRNILVVLIGVAAYYGLLGLSYAWAPYATIPQWWREHTPSGPVALVSWFGLINISGALVASIPVAFGLIIRARDHAAGLSIVIGFLVGLVISISGFAEYGAPADARTWVTDAVQFLAVASAISVSAAILGRLRLVGRRSRP